MQWLQEPAQRNLLNCITSAMPSVTSIWWPPVSFASEIIFRWYSFYTDLAWTWAAFDWKKLAADAVVVDVGSIMRPAYGIDLAKQHPNLRFIVQESSAQLDVLQKVIFPP